MNITNIEGIVITPEKFKIKLNRRSYSQSSKDQVIYDLSSKSPKINQRETPTFEFKYAMKNSQRSSHFLYQGHLERKPSLQKNFCQETTKFHLGDEEFLLKSIRDSDFYQFKQKIQSHYKQSQLNFSESIKKTIESSKQKHFKLDNIDRKELQICFEQQIENEFKCQSNQEFFDTFKPKKQNNFQQQPGQLDPVEQENGFRDTELNLSDVQRIQYQDIFQSDLSEIKQTDKSNLQLQQIPSPNRSNFLNVSFLSSNSRRLSSNPHKRSQSLFPLQHNNKKHINPNSKQTNRQNLFLLNYQQMETQNMDLKKHFKKRVPPTKSEKIQRRNSYLPRNKSNQLENCKSLLDISKKNQ